MRLFTSVFIILLVFVYPAFSQTHEEEMLNILKQDFKQVNVVANVEIEKVEIDGEWKTQNNSIGYTMYRSTGRIIESFKGKLKKGEPVVFYSFIEGQPPAESLKRNYVRFLNYRKNDNGQKRLLELENSGAETNEKNLLILRKLR